MEPIDLDRRRDPQRELAVTRRTEHASGWAVAIHADIERHAIADPNAEPFERPDHVTAEVTGEDLKGHPEGERVDRDVHAYKGMN